MRCSFEDLMRTMEARRMDEGERKKSGQCSHMESHLFRQQRKKKYSTVAAEITRMLSHLAVNSMLTGAGLTPVLFFLPLARSFRMSKCIFTPGWSTPFFSFRKEMPFTSSSSLCEKTKMADLTDVLITGLAVNSFQDRIYNIIYYTLYLYHRSWRENGKVGRLNNLPSYNTIKSK